MIMKNILFFSLILLSGPTHAAFFDSADSIEYQGKTYCMVHNKPLERYFVTHVRPKFQIFAIDGHPRGYVGHWKIHDNGLYLEKIDATIDNKIARLDHIFPDTHITPDGLVKATWYSGTLMMSFCYWPEIGYKSVSMIPDENDRLRLTIEHGELIED